MEAPSDYQRWLREHELSGLLAMEDSSNEAALNTELLRKVGVLPPKNTR